jgi:hypothetical protein
MRAKTPPHEASAIKKGLVIPMASFYLGGANSWMIASFTGVLVGTVATKAGGFGSGLGSTILFFLGRSLPNESIILSSM